ncbi:MAG: hypothetical protein ACO1RX_03445 [Candidatus Sericytochromatia bacterium]
MPINMLKRVFQDMPSSQIRALILLLLWLRLGQLLVNPPLWNALLSLDMLWLLSVWGLHVHWQTQRVLVVICGYGFVAALIPGGLLLLPVIGGGLGWLQLKAYRESVQMEAQTWEPSWLSAWLSPRGGRRKTDYAGR